MSNINKKNIQKRYKKAERFKYLCASAILISCSFLIILMTSIGFRAYKAFYQIEISLPIDLTNIKDTNFNKTKVINQSIKELFGKNIEKELILPLITSPEKKLTEYIKNNPSLIGKKSELNFVLVSNYKELRKSLDVQLNDKLRLLQKKKIIKRKFNFNFFTNGDSRFPEKAGILGSLLGSVYTILVCILFAFPIAVLTAIYLEEFAPKNKFTEFIELNINNLAAVPSVVFGLLGLTFIIGIAGAPRSSSLAGGMTLSLMIIPTIIITTRQSIKAIPISLKHSALALGASPMQVTLHHTLPLAMPGIMTGTILGICRALGETAPLIMIGMVAFIVDLPQSVLDPATVMPVQIYLWADNPEPGFIEKTSAAIMILLLFLCLINILAVYIRKKYEKRW